MVELKEKRLRKSLSEAKNECRFCLKKIFLTDFLDRFELSQKAYSVILSFFVASTIVNAPLSLRSQYFCNIATILSVGTPHSSIASTALLNPHTLS